jgi:peptidoglycan/LPS O-acetylase OafA/YrhL
MASTGSDARFPILDGLRAMSILLVLACHLLPLGPHFLRLNETAGAMGMSLFFALSGFLITFGLMRNASVSEFLARRLARITPLAYAYTALVFLVLTFNPKALMYTDLFLTNYLGEYVSLRFTPHFWSLCVEVQFYIAIAVVLLIAGRRALWIVWPACIAITFLRWRAGIASPGETHLRVDEILAGACLATVLTNIPTFRPHPILLILTAFSWVIFSHPFVGKFECLRSYATALLLLVAINYGATNAASVIVSGPMRYVANISYALYVIHPLTAYGWMNEGSVLIKYLLKRPISLVLTFTLAHLSTFYWERPWQLAVKGWIQKRRQTASVELAGSAQQP